MHDKIRRGSHGTIDTAQGTHYARRRQPKYHLCDGELSTLHTIIHGPEAAFLRPLDDLEEQERADQ